MNNVIQKNISFSRCRVEKIAVAGDPKDIYKTELSFVDIPNLKQIPQKPFLIKVKGNSLKDAYVMDGDHLIVDPEREIRNSDLVVINYKKNTLVKRFYILENKIELHSENSEYETIIFDRDEKFYRIVGVVIGIYRAIK